MNDPILDELRQIKEANAARFNYDIGAMFDDLLERHKKVGFKFIDGVARHPDYVPSVGEVGTIGDKPAAIPKLPVSEL